LSGIEDRLENNNKNTFKKNNIEKYNIQRTKKY